MSAQETRPDVVAPLLISRSRKPGDHVVNTRSHRIRASVMMAVLPSTSIDSRGALW